MQIWSHHKRVCEAQGTKQLISSHEKGLSLLKIAIIVPFISLLLSPCMEIVHPSGLGHFWTPSRVFEFRVWAQFPIWALQAPFSHAHKRGGGVVLEIFCILFGCANCAILIVVCFAILIVVCFCDFDCLFDLRFWLLFVLRNRMGVKLPDTWGLTGGRHPNPGWNYTMRCIIW